MLYSKRKHQAISHGAKYDQMRVEQCHRNELKSRPSITNDTLLTMITKDPNCADLWYRSEVADVALDAT